MENKICRICKIIKSQNEFYKNKSSQDGLHPYCKKCAIEKSKKYQKDNPEKKINYDKSRYNKNENYYKDKAQRWNTANNEVKKLNQINWQRDNRDKIKEYKIRRQMRKNHNIEPHELNMLYEYARSSCMYCGTEEAEAIKIFNQKLHRDHAINRGSDGIENCILACKSCNSSKRDKDWDIWFKGVNFYSEDRYNAISNWLNIWK